MISNDLSLLFFKKFTEKKEYKSIVLHNWPKKFHQFLRFPSKKFIYLLILGGRFHPFLRFPWRFPAVVFSALLPHHSPTCCSHFITETENSKILGFFKVFNFYSVIARFNTKDLKIANLIGIFVDKFFKEGAKFLANLVGETKMALEERWKCSPSLFCLFFPSDWFPPSRLQSALCANHFREVDNNKPVIDLKSGGMKLNVIHPWKKAWPY